MIKDNRSKLDRDVMVSRIQTGSFTSSLANLSSFNVLDTNKLDAANLTNPLQMMDHGRSTFNSNALHGFLRQVPAARLHK